MLLRALKDHHFALYQALLALIGLTFVLVFLGSYPWMTAILYSALAMGSFFGGWNLVSLIQRERSRRRRSRSTD